MVIDMGVMTPRNKRANSSEDSSSSGSGRLWIADGSESSSNDDSVTVNAKLGQRKKKKILAERKSDYFLKDKETKSPGKGKVSNTTVNRPKPLTSATLDKPSTVGSVSNQCRPNAQSAASKPPTETAVDTSSVN